ncbi:hypothetical protein ACPPVQ_05805 [Diaminobutyricibacter sp. McL0618]|uniref:hypothetical protein n=1 Tax=Leifsonia sp. McL0618 TaxID=3415677 RepID=UPI003CFA2836
MSETAVMELTDDRVTEDKIASAEKGAVSALAGAAPVLASNQGPDPIAKTGYMSSSATLDAQGALSVQTHIWSVQWLKGFTGGVQVVVGDVNGNIIATSPLQQYGVDGTMTTLPSSRTVNWMAALGPAAAANGHTLKILHMWSPKNRLGIDIPKIETTVKTIAELIAAIAAVATVL